MIRRLSAGFLISFGPFLLVSAVSLTYGLLETYADPRLGVLDNLAEFLAPLVLGSLLGLGAFAGGVLLVATPRVTAALTVVVTAALVAGCWIGGERGIDAKERELAGVTR